MPSGGARVGAGRKSKREKFAQTINTTERAIAKEVPELVALLLILAKGGIVSEKKTYEPAATIMMDATQIVESEKHGPRSVRVKVPAYPDAEEGEMVLVKREESVTLPDRAAIDSLLNRILGTPTARDPYADMTDEDLRQEAARTFGGTAPEGDSTSSV